MSKTQLLKKKPWLESACGIDSSQKATDSELPEKTQYEMANPHVLLRSRAEVALLFTTLQKSMIRLAFAVPPSRSDAPAQDKSVEYTIRHGAYVAARRTDPYPLILDAVAFAPRTSHSRIVSRLMTPDPLPVPQ
jgi:hypothetical protein